MKSKNDYPGIELAITRQARHHAKCLKKQMRFNGETIEDLEQTLMCCMLEHLDKYDPEKGNLNTFASMVVRSQTTSLIRSQSRPTLEHTYQHESVFTCDEIEMQQFKLIDKATERLMLSTDIEKILMRLPPDLRYIATLLQHHSVTEVARLIHQSTMNVYHMLIKMRPYFKTLSPE